MENKNQKLKLFKMYLKVQNFIKFFLMYCYFGASFLGFYTFMRIIRKPLLKTQIELQIVSWLCFVAGLYFYRRLVIMGLDIWTTRHAIPTDEEMYKREGKIEYIKKKFNIEEKDL